VSPTGSRLQTKLAELRKLFDNGFAAPEQSQRAAVEHMLAVTVGGERFAISVSDISGLTVAKGTILPVPSSVPELLGITGIRGVVVPVFNLAALLGIGRGRAQYRWLILCGVRQAPLALAVDLVEEHLEIAADQLIARGPDETAHYIKQTVDFGDMLRGVIDLGLVVEKIWANGRIYPNSEE
jgi:chemotaxis signal transduction protein